MEYTSSGILLGLLTKKRDYKAKRQDQGYWDYAGELVSDITDEIVGGLVADNNYISNVIEALSNTPLIQELDAALNILQLAYLVCKQNTLDLQKNKLQMLQHLLTS